MSDLNTLVGEVNNFEVRFSKNIDDFLNFVIYLDKAGFKVSSKSLRSFRSFGFKKSFRFTPKSIVEILNKVKITIKNIKSSFSDIYNYALDNMLNEGYNKSKKDTLVELINDVCNSLFYLSSFFRNMRVYIKKSDIIYFKKVLLDEVVKFELTKEDGMNAKLYVKKVKNFEKIIFNNLSNLLFFDENNKNGAFNVLDNMRLNLKVFKHKFDDNLQIHNPGSLLPLTLFKQEKVSANFEIGKWVLDMVIHMTMEFKFAMPLFVKNEGNVEMFALDVLGSTNENGPIKFFNQRYDGKHFNGALKTGHSRTLHTTGQSLCDDVKGHIIDDFGVIENYIKSCAVPGGVFFIDMHFVVNTTPFSNRFKFEAISVQKVVYKRINFGKVYVVAHITPTRDNVLAAATSSTVGGSFASSQGNAVGR